MVGNMTVGDQLTDILEGYTKEVHQKAEKEIQKVAKETARKIKDASPQSGKGGRSYADGWAVKKDAGITIIYNRYKPQLTHLLENGHAKVNGGRVPGRAHIAPAESWAESELVSRIERELE